MRIVTEGHLSGFLNYLVRKFCSRWSFALAGKGSESFTRRVEGRAFDTTRFSTLLVWIVFFSIFRNEVVLF